MSRVQIAADDVSDDVPAFGDEHVQPRGATCCSLARARHPCVTSCHVAFCLGSLLVYLLCDLLALSFSSTFVMIVILLSAEFWTVKNLSGRLLAGLRWWNHVDPTTGRSCWLFETRRGAKHPSCTPVERHVFWTFLTVAPVLWAVLLILSFIGLHYAYMLLPIVGVTLTSANLYGYLRCRYGTTSRGEGGDEVLDVRQMMTNWSQRLLQQHLLANIAAVVQRKGGTTAAGGSVPPLVV